MNNRSINKLGSSLSRCFRSRRAKLLWLAGSVATLAIVLASCGTVTHAIMAPPNIPGATFVGSKACADCHEELVRDFKTAGHARLMAKGKNAENAGCESCHGPGSLHVSSGGASRTIVNPRKDPETCFQCHLEIRSKFQLPYRHAVMEGRMNCADCHNPHKGSVYKGGGATNIMSKNEICFQCHTAQRGPFVFEHEAMREGCTTCHDPHGSINQKMLTARNQILCQKCHFQQQRKTNPGSLYIGGDNHRSVNSGNVARGTCWSAGCHETIHGSQVNQHFRY